MIMKNNDNPLISFLPFHSNKNKFEQYYLFYKIDHMVSIYPIFSPSIQNDTHTFSFIRINSDNTPGYKQQMQLYDYNVIYDNNNKCIKIKYKDDSKFFIITNNKNILKQHIKIYEHKRFYNIYKTMVDNNKTHMHENNEHTVQLKHIIIQEKMLINTLHNFK